jgi:hypothetical protein
LSRTCKIFKSCCRLFAARFAATHPDDAGRGAAFVETPLLPGPR